MSPGIRSFVLCTELDAAHIPIAMALFWSAFKGKLGPVMKPEDKALGFLEQIVDPDFAISAVDRNGDLLGVAGFKTADGSFVGGDLNDLARIYGWFGGTWRGLVLSLLERPLDPDTLLMDGIFVSPAARGQGVGTALLSAIKDRARELGLGKVRLDVIDSNPRARALYEREGFVAADSTDIGPLRHLFAFRRSATMIHHIIAAPESG